MITIIKVVLWATYLISLYFAIFWFMVFLTTNNKTKNKAITNPPFVSIVIPAYNEEKRIKPTIQSVLGLDYPADKFELIVVNDGSKDQTAQIIEGMINGNKKFNIKTINQKNKGKGAALNAGLKLSRGEFFVSLDADSFVEKSALKKILPHFTQDDIAAVLPVLKVKKPKNLLQRIQWFEYIVNIFYKELMSRLDCVHVAPGPFCVYKKDIIKKLNGFDENDNLTEDLEMALRLQYHNYKLVQLLDVDVHTIAPASIKELYSQRNRWYKGSILNAFKYRHMFFNKKYGDFGLIQMPTIVISGLIALVLTISMAYYGLKPHIKYLYHLKFVNFDVIPLLKNFVINFNFLDLNYMALSLILVMLGISITIIKKSHRYTREKIVKKNILPLVLYLFVYFVLLGVMWVGITIDLITRKKQRW